MSDDAPLAWCRSFAAQLAHGTLDRAGASAWLGTVRDVSDEGVVTLDSFRPELAEATVRAPPPVSRASTDVVIRLALVETPAVALGPLERVLGTSTALPFPLRKIEVRIHDAPYDVVVIVQLATRGSGLNGLRFERRPVRPWPRRVPMFSQATGAMRVALAHVLTPEQTLNKLATHILLTGHYDRGVRALADGHLVEARASFAAALVQREAMAAAVLEDTKLQRDAAEVHARLADIAAMFGELATARDHLARELELLRAIAAAEPDTRTWQIDLAAAYERLGDVDARAGNLDDARGWFEHALTGLDGLRRAAPQHTRWQRDEVAIFHKLGEVGLRDHQLRDARGWFEHALAASQALLAIEPLNPGHQLDACMSLACLAQSTTDASAAAHELAASRAIYDWLARRGIYHGYDDFDALGAQLDQLHAALSGPG